MISSFDLFVSPLSFILNWTCTHLFLVLKIPEKYVLLDVMFLSVSLSSWGLVNHLHLHGGIGQNFNSSKKLMFLGYVFLKNLIFSSSAVYWIDFSWLGGICAENFNLIFQQLSFTWYQSYNTNFFYFKNRKDLM